MTDNPHRTPALPENSLLARHLYLTKGLLLLLGTLLLGLFICGFVSAGWSALTGADSRDTLLLTAASQALLAFILPAIVTMRIMGADFAARMGMTYGFTIRALVLLTVVFVVSMPMMEQLVWWNEHIEIPGHLGEVLRQMEETNGSVGRRMLDTISFGGMLSGVLVVGILTGIAEELFFRGAMQRMMVSAGIRPYMAIWVTAVIFSVMHFQFYGLLPRILMGAWFGYIFYKTRSIWASATAHALNNSAVVVTAWLGNRGIISVDDETFGATVSGFPWPAVISAVITGIVLWRLGKFFVPALRKCPKD